MLLTVMTAENRRLTAVDTSEMDMLIDFLNFQRDTLLWKLNGLDDEQLRRPHQPSGLTLLGIVRHVTNAERSWFRKRVAGQLIEQVSTPDDLDADWRIQADDTTDRVIAAYQTECAAVDELVRARDLDALVAAPPDWPGAAGMKVRWVVLHMIEETARHVGHADLMREAIDGQTGE